MPGPAPKPKSVAQGRRDRPQLALVHDERSPEPPAGLGPEALGVWEGFWTSPVARAIDLTADAHRLVRWIGYVDEWHKTSKAFRRKRIVKGSTGQPALNPLAAYIATLEAAMQKTETEFGMTPMARLKLGIAFGEAAMTAEKLNQMIDEPKESSGGDSDFGAGDFIEA